MTLKLILFFVTMDLLTLLIYPIVFAHGILNRLVNGREKLVLVNRLSPVLAPINSSLKEG